MHSPRSDPEKPLKVRAEAVTIVVLKAELNYIYDRHRLTIRLQLSNDESKILPLEARDWSGGNPPATAFIQKDIRFLHHEFFANRKGYHIGFLKTENLFIFSDSLQTVMIGLAWRDAPEQWLGTPVKLYLQIIP